MPAVAVIQTAFIGDVVLATPLFEAARVSNPGAAVIGVVKKGCENLLGNNPFMDEVYYLGQTRGSPGHSRHARISRENFRRREVGTARSFRTVPSRTALTAMLGGIRCPGRFREGRRSVSSIPGGYPIEYGIHEVERNLMLAEAAGWKHEGFAPAIFPG